jgi:hypothetical protein
MHQHVQGLPQTSRSVFPSGPGHRAARPLSLVVSARLAMCMLHTRRVLRRCATAQRGETGVSVRSGAMKVQFHSVSVCAGGRAAASPLLRQSRSGAMKSGFSCRSGAAFMPFRRQHGRIAARRVRGPASAHGPACARGRAWPGADASRPGRVPGSGRIVGPGAPEALGGAADGSPDSRMPGPAGGRARHNVGRRSCQTRTTISCPLFPGSPSAGSFSRASGAPSGASFPPRSSVQPAPRPVSWRSRVAAGRGSGDAAWTATASRAA